MGLGSFVKPRNTALDNYAMGKLEVQHNPTHMDMETFKHIMNMPVDVFQSPQAQQNAAQQLAQAQVQALQSPAQVDPHMHAHHMLMDRLHGVAGAAFMLSTNDYLFTHVHTNKVYVFFIHDERAGHLEDDISLFPSDRLITQVRLLWSS